jgi:hypothetical protein
MAKYILFDTETTGNKEEDRIIQIGAMVIQNKGKIEIYDELCSCEIPIKIEAKEYDITIKAHNAMGNVLVMKLLLSKLVQIVRENFPGINPMDKLVELTKTPVFIKTFRFGKYKGEDIEDVCKKRCWIYKLDDE